MDHRELERLNLEQGAVRDRELERDEGLREQAGAEGLELRELFAERDEERQKLVILTIKALFEKKTVTVSQLGLPEQQQVALEALQSAITSRHTTGEFVFADDRRTLLEQALAILQPTLTGAAPELLAELGSMEKLTDKVASLRAKLDKLEDAQEVLPEWERHEWFEEAGEGAETAKTSRSRAASPRRSARRSRRCPRARKSSRRRRHRRSSAEAPRRRRCPRSRRPRCRPDPMSRSPRCRRRSSRAAPRPSCGARVRRRSVTASATTRTMAATRRSSRRPVVLPPRATPRRRAGSGGS